MALGSAMALAGRRSCNADSAAVGPEDDREAVSPKTGLQQIARIVAGLCRAALALTVADLAAIEGRPELSPLQIAAGSDVRRLCTVHSCIGCRSSFLPWLGSWLSGHGSRCLASWVPEPTAPAPAQSAAAQQLTDQQLVGQASAAAAAAAAWQSSSSSPQQQKFGAALDSCKLTQT